MASVTALRDGTAALTVVAGRDLDAVWRHIVGSDDPATILHDVLPTLITTYGQAAATLAADWYDEDRTDINAAKPFRAVPASVDDQGAHALVGWAVSTATDDAALRSLIGGGMQRRILNPARETIITSAVQDPAADGWQRHASGSACLFCQMLAGRGAVYSEDTVNFGAHDGCSCHAVPAWGGQPARVKPYTPSVRYPDTDAGRQAKAAATKSAKAWMVRNEPTIRADTQAREARLAAEAKARADAEAAAKAEAAKPRKVSPFAGKSLDDLQDDMTAAIAAERYDDMDAIAAEIDRREAANAKSRARRAAAKQAKQDAQDAEYDRLLAEGVDDETAIEQAYGVPVPEQRRQNARAILDALGFHGRGLDEQVAAWHKAEAREAWLAAEDATNGYMLNKLGQRKGIDAASLWTATEATARKYASDELLAWWDEHGRVTRAELKAQLLDPVQAARIQSQRRDYLQ